MQDAKPRICILHHVNGMGGGSKSCIDIVTMLQDAYDVIVCIPKGESELKKELIKCNASIYELHNPIGSFPYYSGSSSVISRVVFKSLIKLKYAKALSEEIMKLSPDLLLFNSVITTVLARYFPLNVKKAVVVRETFKGTIFDNIFKNEIQKHFYAVLYIANNERRYLKLKSKKEMIAPDCLSPDLGVIHNESNIEETDKFTVLYLGGYPRLKGVDVLLKAVYLIDTTDVKLEIAGYFSEKQLELRNLFKIQSPVSMIYLLKVRKYYYLLKKRNQVAVLGYCSNIEQHIQKCSVIVFPSTKPHQSRPAFEAGAFHKPVVITDFEETKEYFIDNFNCLTFKNKDSYELAHKIKLLLSNPKECQRLGDNNFEYTNKYHNYYDIKKKLVAFFGELLN